MVKLPLTKNYAIQRVYGYSVSAMGEGCRKPIRLPAGGGSLRLWDDAQLIDNLRFTADDFSGVILNVLRTIRVYAVSCYF